MDAEMLRGILGWCAVVNAGLLMGWFAFFWLAHDWMYRFHGRLFRVSVEQFDAIHYAGLAAFKVAIFMLNLTPYLVLSMMAN